MPEVKAWVDAGHLQAATVAGRLVVRNAEVEVFEKWFLKFLLKGQKPPSQPAPFPAYDPARNPAHRRAKSTAPPQPPPKAVLPPDPAAQRALLCDLRKGLAQSLLMLRRGTPDTNASPHPFPPVMCHCGESATRVRWNAKGQFYRCRECNTNQLWYGISDLELGTEVVRRVL